ncbi:MAG: ATP phosphoribosyltransferase regulatory subunit, partial [Sulfitobacter sp.]
DRRKSALMRHIWRPRKFRALLDRFAGRVPLSSSRAALVADAMPDIPTPLIGLRSKAEIKARLAIIREDATTDPISAAEVDLIAALLGVREMMPFALENLRDLAVDIPAIGPVVERMKQRVDAMDTSGIDVASLPFEANYGRTSMEYYDGFVFGFYSVAHPDKPAVATGGRYDALTRRLGQGAEIPAVGGVLRPGLMLELEAAS